MSTKPSRTSVAPRKRSTPSRRASSSKISKKTSRSGSVIVAWIDARIARPKKKLHDYLRRRPHRSFRMTRRRDYSRSLKLPGYWLFTWYVFRTLRDHKMTFLSLALVYAIMTVVLVGVGSQETYSELYGSLQETSENVFSGNWGEVGKASILFLATIQGGILTTPTEVQQVYGSLIALLTWLTTVWLLRQYLNGQRVRLRDGVYNAASPLVSTMIVALILLLQLFPLALAFIGYNAALLSGLIQSGGVAAMLFWVAFSLLAVMSLYWTTSTFFALIVVTLPGMYPFRAVKIAGDMVVGRRLRLLLRILWSAVGLLIVWAVVLIPIILLDGWAKSVWPAIEWLPVVPSILLLLMTLSIVWISAYVYLLYRKVVDDDAKPA